MFVPNNVHSTMCKEIKAILSGCDTILDANYFGEQYANKYPEMRSLIWSIIKGKTYTDNLDVKTKQDLLRDIFMCDYYSDAEKMITKLGHKINDDTYKRTLNRIANLKQKQHFDAKNTRRQVVCKKCPHCDCIMSAQMGTTYVICGYNDTKLGYDWRGCCGDWCFECGKMLCKKWQNDALHCDKNRIHTTECCKNHAIENETKYPDDYCQCSNIYVRRNVDLELNDFNLFS